MSEQTRRGWLVTISQAAAAWSVADVAAGETRPAVSLPPGVYAPHSDHLSHALMSAEAFHPKVSGCPTDYIGPRIGPFRPLFFSRDEFAVIRNLTGLLLGETPNSEERSQLSVTDEAAEWIDLCIWSSVGVREATAHIDPLPRALTIAYYGPAQYAKLQSVDPAKVCREGLAWINEAATARHSKGFAALNRKQQVDLLGTISDVSSGERSSHVGERFFDYLKRETARSFYTSISGLKELDFKGNAFYARSPGCGSKRV